MIKILYIHGLAGGKNARTAKLIQNYFKDKVEVIAPEFPLDPNDAIKLANELNELYRPTLVLGSSLGAFFTQFIDSPYRILINPAMYPSKDLLTPSIGLGTHTFNKDRDNGETTFEITTDLINKFKEVEEYLYNNNNVTNIDNTFGLFGNCDPLFSHIEDYKKIYKRKPMLFDGEHRLSDENVIGILIPLINKILIQESLIFCF